MINIRASVTDFFQALRSRGSTETTTENTPSQSEHPGQVVISYTLGEPNIYCVQISVRSRTREGMISTFEMMTESLKNGGYQPQGSGGGGSDGTSMSVSITYPSNFRG